MDVTFILKTSPTGSVIIYEYISKYYSKNAQKDLKFLVLWFPVNPKKKFSKPLHFKKIHATKTLRKKKIQASNFSVAFWDKVETGD